MHNLTLSAKAYNDFQLRIIQENLEFALKGLNVKIKICGTTPQGYVQATVSGEDEKIAQHYLAEEIGLCPSSPEELKKFTLISGRVASLSKSADGLHVDIGVTSAFVPLSILQAQLVDGRKAALKKIVSLFGFCEDMPLTIKILQFKETHAVAMLSEEQVALYKEWATSLLDRLLIIGEPLDNIKNALKTAGCNRDITKLEHLGMLEHAIVLKLDTDAAGIIPKIGRILKNARLSAFSSKEIFNFLGQDYFNTQ